MDTTSPRVATPKAEAVIRAGSTGIVYSIGDSKVMKKGIRLENYPELDVERRVYELLGPHPSIARYFGSTHDGSAIILERGQCLRSLCQEASIHDIPITKRLHWAQDIAIGLQYIHRKGIIHADVGCHNIIITQDRHPKLIDFAGSSIDGEEPKSCYEWFSYRPSEPSSSIQTDIFAYGCTIFEIERGKPPYHEFEPRSDRTRHVERLYQSCEFPDTQHLIFGEIIQNCWERKFYSMDEVIQALSKRKIKLKVYRAAVYNFLSQWKRSDKPD